jgi:hypothetical protein
MKTRHVVVDFRNVAERAGSTEMVAGWIALDYREDAGQGQ